MNTEIKQEETQVIEAAPRKMTAAENAILTIKVLVGFALLGGVIWAIDVWKTAP